MLVGSPPGIVGYGPPGLLIESVRLRPRQVILLERIEEAHTDAQNMLLAIAEQGSLFDNFGRQIDFRGTVILMTTAGGVPPQSVILPDLLNLLDGLINCG
jgi:ATP-dependent Clp protease ATP-binding subunit ClpC